jgi:hypothetical protein
MVEKGKLRKSVNPQGIGSAELNECLRFLFLVKGHFEVAFLHS